ncbi:hypothetical protein ACLOJK_040978 [Asimina triloba]
MKPNCKIYIACTQLRRTAGAPNSVLHHAPQAGSHGFSDGSVPLQLLPSIQRRHPPSTDRPPHLHPTDPDPTAGVFHCMICLHRHPDPAMPPPITPIGVREEAPLPSTAPAAPHAKPQPPSATDSIPIRSQSTASSFRPSQQSDAGRSRSRRRAYPSPPFDSTPTPSPTSDGRRLLPNRDPQPAARSYPSVLPADDSALSPTTATSSIRQQAHPHPTATNHP